MDRRDLRKRRNGFLALYVVFFALTALALFFALGIL